MLSFCAIAANGSLPPVAKTCTSRYACMYTHNDYLKMQRHKASANSAQSSIQSEYLSASRVQIERFAPSPSDDSADMRPLMMPDSSTSTLLFARMSKRQFISHVFKARSSVLTTLPDRPGTLNGTAYAGYAQNLPAQPPKRYE